MCEEITQNMPSARPFEERVLASLASIEARLGALEEQAERRAMETKPIWERALAEIIEVREAVENVERKIDVLSRDMVQMRADQVRADGRLQKLESRPM